MQSEQRSFFTFFTTFIFLTVFTRLLALDVCLCPCDPDPVCWQGFYLNGQLGMGLDREHEKFANANYFNTLGPVLLGSDFNHKSEGFIAGGALGYNYQMESLVVGLEAGAVSSNFKKKRRSPFFPKTDVFTSHLQCITTAKARVGYACDTLLTYVTGGWASGHYALKLDDTSADTVAKSKTWANGWTVGVGFDCKFAGCLSMGLEYDYIQLQFHNKTASCPHCGIGVGLGSPKIDNRFQVQTLTVRVNYFFDL